MRLTVDANVIVAAVAGRSRSLLDAAISASSGVVIPVAQAREVRKVLVDKIGMSAELVENVLSELFAEIAVVADTVVQRDEGRARSRLQKRGQPDWPVLAAALSLDTVIWSNDRDFFGVGVPVWSTRTMPFAIEEANAEA